MNFEEAKERAVKYLVLALRTEKEVKDKLRKLNVEEDIIDEVCIIQKHILDNVNLFLNTLNMKLK